MPKKPEIIGSGGPILPRFNLKLPGRTGYFIIAGVVVAILGVLFIRTCYTYIRPNEFGIKQVNIGLNPGIHEKVYGAGYVFRMPFGFETIHRFPRNMQTLDLTERRVSDLETHQRDQMAKIQTSDGFFVDVDVSILYRIVDPYMLITTLGKGERFLDQGIMPKAEPVLKRTLGELTTEEFYNSYLRVEKAQLAQEILDSEVESYGIDVDNVLVRFFRYSDEIQKNIEEKKLQDQLVFKNQSEAHAATEMAEIMRIREEGEANVKITLQEGDAYRVQKEAERDLYVRRKNAEADLLVQLAEAKRTELKNEAMQALGADRAVALEMADVLRGMDVVIVPSGGAGGMNPLDLEAMVNLFGVQELGLGTSAPAPAEVTASPADALEEADRRADAAGEGVR